MLSIPESPRLPEDVADDPYADWRRNEGALLGGGLFVENVADVELAPWPRKGVNGALYYLDGDDEEDEHIVEIPPGGSTTPEHHLYYETIYIVRGRGTTSLWWDEDRKTTFDWAEGSVFALPLNIRYQFSNGSSTEPARYLSITNLPSMLRQFHNDDFIFNCPATFTDQFAGGAFGGEGKLYRGRHWETDLVPDVRQLPLLPHPERGSSDTNLGLNLAGGNIEAHVSRVQPGTYRKGHKHGAHTHFYVLEGEGFTLAQRRDERWTRVDWSRDSLFLSGAGPGYWLHQHFNTGSTPATYFATHSGPTARYTAIRWHVTDPTWTSPGSVNERAGGRQVEYADEDPEIHRFYEAELAKRGLVCRMKGIHPACTGVAGS